ncbi:4'-phosphopantetheinyl transferase family protein [Brevibacillus choshinensis]|uniref:4'-phosphopantetheinyl transferase superfamily protein n=1 Tax=Brevibacillus choshinensis TaxID=54911 RepID=A0ABX7FVF9_BRECH|nr:4'-phosphopantetheinyl transferase superfamily protein [Brevibacillus choshinensis]QRG69740.1 4'-phosphopantetheinyl transferase superfamily protein [Brevibacillus choshinensis]
MLVSVASEYDCWERGEWPIEAANGGPFLKKKEVHVWVASVSSVLPGNFDLSHEEEAKATRFLSRLDQKRYRFSRMLLRLLLSAYVQCDPSVLRFGKNHVGKPFLFSGDKESHIRFNLSHTRDAVCYVMAFDQEVGIDMEYIDDRFDWQSVSHSFFSDLEKQLLHSKQGNDQLIAFYQIWTRKEAYLKAKGMGLAGLDEWGRLKDTSTFEDVCLHDFRYRDQYVGTLALESTLPSVRYFQFPNA